MAKKLKMKIEFRYEYDEKENATAMVDIMKKRGDYKCVELVDSGLDLVIYAAKK